MHKEIFIVTGAPGAGKTSSLDELLRLDNPGFLAFDLDWLMESASALAGKDVVVDRPSWKPFRQIWFVLLEAILKNNKTPVLFANINKQDVAELAIAQGVVIKWALLDCSDDERRDRVTGRQNMTEEGILDNVSDGRELRKDTYDLVLDTDRLNSAEVAQNLKQWIEKEIAS